MGHGKSDSDLDVLLYSNQDLVDEQLLLIKCGQVDQLIDSHHDVVISTCTIPCVADALVQPLLNQAPRIENRRHKIAWSEEGLADYESIVSRLLPGIRERWLLSSSQASTSILIQSTNALLSLAA